MSNTVVEEIARIEGHGSLYLIKENGEIRADFVVEESPRFFEALLAGRRWRDASLIASRICGICSTSHTFACLKAIESVLGIEPDEQVVLLRKLLQVGELVQSHSLHLFFLALPDFLQADSSISLAATHPLEIERALKLKRLGNEIVSIVAGRSTHPITAAIGGFRKYPKKSDFQKLKDELMGARLLVEASVELFKGLSFPQFSRPTEFVALRNENEYAFYEGKLVSSEGWKIEPIQFKDKINEKAVSGCTAKLASTEKGCYMVGPLARFNLNAHLLEERAKAAAEFLGLTIPDYNPFHQNLARVVELVYLVEKGIKIVDLLLDRNVELLAENNFSVREQKCSQSGKGVGIVEAPRGLLFYQFDVEREGFVREADIITPTAQNIANLVADLNAFWFSSNGYHSEQDVLKEMEVLVRAYDPCLSCSAH